MKYLMACPVYEARVVDIDPARFPTFLIPRSPTLALFGATEPHPSNPDLVVCMFQRGYTGERYETCREHQP